MEVKNRPLFGTGESIVMPDKKTPLINALNAGELSPKIDVRSDVDKYYQGCRTLENVIPIVPGGVIRMPGTCYVGKAKGD